jgi:hypothetical protein
MMKLSKATSLIGMIQPKEGKIVFAGEACFDIGL